MIRPSHIKAGIPFLIHHGILTKLNNDTTPFKGNPAIPVVGKNGLNYLETIAVRRYENLIETFQRTIGVTNVTPMHVMMNSFENIFAIERIEKPHWRLLEEMAVKYVKEDFNLIDDEILFDVEIVGFGNVTLPKSTNYEPPQPLDPDDEPNAKLEYEMNDEVHKRRFINALTAGASKKGHYIFHLAEEELNQFNPQLIELYQKMMIANDLTYYMMPDEMAQMAMSNNEEGQTGANAGSMEIRWDENGKPIVYVKAVNFPTLIHEIVKGIMEIISYIALPEGKTEQQFVIDNADHVLGEMWDLRLGPIFWEAFHGSLKLEEIGQKKMILSRLYQLETSDFFEHFNKQLKSDLDK